MGGTKRDKQNGTNGFLRKSAVSCGFLRKSAVSCGFLQKSAPPKCCNSQEKRKSAKIMRTNCESCAFVPFSLDAAFLLTVGSFLLTVGAFLLTVDNFSFFAYSWSFFAYSFSFFTYSWSFFASNGKVRLIRALRDCKQRSLTVRKKAPTVSKKASPF